MTVAKAGTLIFLGAMVFVLLNVFANVAAIVAAIGAGIAFFGILADK